MFGGNVNARQRHLLVILNVYCQCASFFLCLAANKYLSHSIGNLLQCQSCSVNPVRLDLKDGA